MRLPVAALLLLRFAAAWAEEVEGNLVYLPIPGVRSIAVDNRLGAVSLRGWDEQSLRIRAEKRGEQPGLVERLKVRVDIADGAARIVAGVYSRDGQWRPIPVAGGSIDLAIEAPRALGVEAVTFRGDVDVAGFRAGARLESQFGRVLARDLRGKVDTRTLGGRQTLEGISGTVAARGVDGDVELTAIGGPSLEATLGRGQVTLRDVVSELVRIQTTFGSIFVVGDLPPRGRYDLRSVEGDLRLTLRPVAFQVTARAPQGRLENAFPLTVERRGPNWVEGRHGDGGAQLQLVSGSGRVTLEPERR